MVGSGPWALGQKQSEGTESGPTKTPLSSQSWYYSLTSARTDTNPIRRNAPPSRLSGLLEKDQIGVHNQRSPSTGVDNPPWGRHNRRQTSNKFRLLSTLDIGITRCSLQNTNAFKKLNTTLDYKKWLGRYTLKRTLSETFWNLKYSC